MLCDADLSLRRRVIVIASQILEVFGREVVGLVDCNSASIPYHENDRSSCWRLRGSSLGRRSFRFLRVRVVRMI